MSEPLERVDALINRVMAEHELPEAKVPMARELDYYETVHQELAPLARALEQENDALKQQMRDIWNARKAQLTR